MSITPKYNSSAEAKKAGWFSRRHETNKEHLETSEKNKNKHRKQIK